METCESCGEEYAVGTGAWGLCPPCVEHRIDGHPDDCDCEGCELPEGWEKTR